MQFVTETELEKKRKLRQEEWEKVRKPEDPKEVPEEEYDSRSLYDRLKEQKDKKQNAWDEEHKLKNMVRGLDDEEAGFLDFVDKAKMDVERQTKKEEDDALDEYRKAVAKENEERLLSDIKSISSMPSVKSTSSSGPSIGVISKASQKTSLSSIVKRKSSSSNNENTEAKKSKTEEPATINAPQLPYVIGVLPAAKIPGIVSYESDDSDNSSSDSTGAQSDIVFDLCGRRIQRTDEC